METYSSEYWNDRKTKLKLKFNSLTDEDLYYYEGKEKEMIESLGYKLGITKLELISIIISL